MLSIFNRENRLLLLVVFCFFVVVVVCIFFLKTLNCCFCSWGGGGGEMEGIFHLALLCLFCQCLCCYLENIFVFLEGKVIN